MTIPFIPNEGESEPEITPTTGTIQGAGFSVLKSRTQSNVTASLKSQLDQQNGWTLWWRNIADALRPAVEQFQQLLYDLTHNPQDVIGSVQNIKMDNQRTVGTFLTEAWKAITKQPGTGKTVDDAVAALSELSDRAGEAYYNAQDASLLQEEIIKSGSNLIKNPGFESTMFGQSVGSFVTEQKHSGSKSLRIIGNGTFTAAYTLLSTDSTPRNLTVSPG